MCPINIFTWACGGSCRGTIYRAPTVARPLKISPAARKRLRAEELLRFRFKPLVVNRTGSLIRGGDLARDLFAERHAGDEPGFRSAALQGGIGCKCRAKARRYATRNTGEPSAGDQSIPNGIGGTSAPHLSNIVRTASWSVQPPERV